MNHTITMYVSCYFNIFYYNLQMLNCICTCIDHVHVHVFVSSTSQVHVYVGVYHNNDHYKLSLVR